MNMEVEKKDCSATETKGSKAEARIDPIVIISVCEARNVAFTVEKQSVCVVRARLAGSDANVLVTPSVLMKKGSAAGADPVWPIDGTANSLRSPVAAKVLRSGRSMLKRGLRIEFLVFEEFLGQEPELRGLACFDCPSAPLSCITRDVWLPLHRTRDDAPPISGPGFPNGANSAIDASRAGAEALVAAAAAETGLLRVSLTFFDPVQVMEFEATFGSLLKEEKVRHEASKNQLKGLNEEADAMRKEIKARSEGRAAMEAEHAMALEAERARSAAEIEEARAAAEKARQEHASVQAETRRQLSEALELQRLKLEKDLGRAVSVVAGAGGASQLLDSIVAGNKVGAEKLREALSEEAERVQAEAKKGTEDAALALHQFYEHKMKEFRERLEKEKAETLEKEKAKLKANLEKLEEKLSRQYQRQLERETEELCAEYDAAIAERRRAHSKALNEEVEKQEARLAQSRVLERHLAERDRDAQVHSLCAKWEEFVQSQREICLNDRDTSIAALRKKMRRQTQQLKGQLVAERKEKDRLEKLLARTSSILEEMSTARTMVLPFSVRDLK
jgi:hypothetical protein